MFLTNHGNKKGHNNNSHNLASVYCNHSRSLPLLFIPAACWMCVPFELFMYYDLQMSESAKC